MNPSTSKRKRNGEDSNEIKKRRSPTKNVKGRNQSVRGKLPKEPETDKEFIFNTTEYEKLIHSAAFIDKSLYIKRFFIGEFLTTVMITAPSGFGRSTNMIMIKKFMEITLDPKGEPLFSVIWDDAGKWKETEEPTENFKIFKRLKIYRCHCDTRHSDVDCEEGRCASRNFFYNHCGQHPVIHLSFKEVISNSKEQFLDSLRLVLHETYRKYAYLMKEGVTRLSPKEIEYFDLYYNPNKYKARSIGDILTGLKRLARCLYKQFKKDVFIMMDDFDVPISQLLNSSEKYDKRYIKFVEVQIGKMASNVLKGIPFVFGGYVVAGVQVEHAQFSYVKDLTLHSFLESPRFSDYCGFTETEVKDLLRRPYFWGLDEEIVKKHCDSHQILSSKTKIFCTSSVLNYLNNWRKAKRAGIKQEQELETKQDQELQEKQQEKELVIKQEEESEIKQEQE